MQFDKLNIIHIHLIFFLPFIIDRKHPVVTQYQQKEILSQHSQDNITCK